MHPNTVASGRVRDSSDPSCRARSQGAPGQSEAFRRWRDASRGCAGRAVRGLGARRSWLHVIATLPGGNSAACGGIKLVVMPEGAIGPYQLLGSLGAGGMGEVYRALDPRIGRQVALKLLPKSLVNDGERRRRFEQEARLAASLNHPNVMAIYDVGLDHDPPYIVAELVSGESLRALIDAGPLAVRKAVDIAAQIAVGIGRRSHRRNRASRPEAGERHRHRRRSRQAARFRRGARGIEKSGGERDGDDRQYGAGRGRGDGRLYEPRAGAAGRRSIPDPTSSAWAW